MEVLFGSEVVIAKALRQGEQKGAARFAPSTPHLSLLPERFSRGPRSSKYMMLPLPTVCPFGGYAGALRPYRSPGLCRARGPLPERFVRVEVQVECARREAIRFCAWCLKAGVLAGSDYSRGFAVFPCRQILVVHNAPLRQPEFSGKVPAGFAVPCFGKDLRDATGKGSDQINDSFETGTN